jgi:hypothetical protein
MSKESAPLGLHVNVLGTGPTLRFAFWIEAPQTPDAPRTFKALPSDVPFDHPNLVRPKAKVAGLPKNLPVRSFLAKIPRLGSCLPIPLPGLITAWDLKGVKFQNRTHNESPYYVEGWVVPPELSLLPFKRFIHAWSETYGPGCVSPDARVVIDLIDALHASLREGPLLPTRTLSPDAWKTPANEVFFESQRTSPQTAWVPPWSLGDLQRLRATLAAEPYLAAVEHEHPEDAVGAREVLGDLVELGEAAVAEDRVERDLEHGAVVAHLAGGLVEHLGAAQPHVGVAPRHQAQRDGDDQPEREADRQRAAARVRVVVHRPLKSTEPRSRRETNCLPSDNSHIFRGFGRLVGFVVG